MINLYELMFLNRRLRSDGNDDVSVYKFIIFILL